MDGPYTKSKKLYDEFTGPTTTPKTYGPDYGRHWAITLMRVTVGVLGAGNSGNGLVGFCWNPEQTSQDGDFISMFDVKLLTNGTLIPVVGSGVFQPYAMGAGSESWIIQPSKRVQYLEHPQALYLAILGVPAFATTFMSALIYEELWDRPICLPPH